MSDTEKSTVLITGDYIYDEILVPNNSKINKSVLTINNHDIEQYFRSSGVNIIYKFIEDMNKNDNKIELEYLPFYEYNTQNDSNAQKIPKLITIEKWRTKKEVEEEKEVKKYYRDGFLGSRHDFYNTDCVKCSKCDRCGRCNSYDTCELYTGKSPSSTKHSVFSIYDRFTSMLVKGEPPSDYTKNVLRTDLTEYLKSSGHIILRTKYFKNIASATEKRPNYKLLLKNSPFNIITKDQALCDKTILLISLGEIRDLETYIPVGTSWEEFITNVNNIFSDPKSEYSDLAEIKYIIITIEDDGIIISHNNKTTGKREYKLICNPNTIDGYHRNHTDEYNKVSGYLSIIQGYLTYKIANPDDKTAELDKKPIEFDKLVTLCQEVYGGVCYLDKLGFRVDDNNSLDIPNDKVINHIKEYAAFIKESSDEEKKLKAEKFSSMHVYDINLDTSPDSDHEKFHFLDSAVEKYPMKPGREENAELEQIGIAIAWAKYIVKCGYKKFYEKLNNEKIFVPYVKFNDLISFDRFEIEQLRDIERSIIDYNKNTDSKSPLSIAVFGEPGSGKSYTIEEIAKDIFPKKSPNFLEFNISQMKNEDELIASFRLIQNEVLKGNLPIVFWDEFDSMYDREELGWLKYFLSPMQSGKFLYNQVEYQIGRCIFIFAGGTCATNKAFIDKCKETGMKKVKAPDFLGRLKATLDIPSLNHQGDRIINDIEDRLHKDSLEIYESLIKKDLETYIMKKGQASKIIEKYAQLEALYNKTTDKYTYGKLLNKDDYQRIRDNMIKKTPDVVESLLKDRYSKFSYMFKRAIVLRQNLLKTLNKKDSDELKIEDPVLNAFLMTDKYYYDARSMIAIINLFHISYKEFTVRTSSIPSSQQLSLHTNEKDFINYCSGKYKELKFDKKYDARKIIKIIRDCQSAFE